MINFRFPKSRRITNLSDIDLLFANGRSIKSPSIMLKWILRDSHLGEEPIQVLIVVSKRRVKKAVDRNRLKRQMREIYRHHQWELKTDSFTEKTLLIAMIYTGHGAEKYHDMERDFMILSERLKKNFSVNTD